MIGEGYDVTIRVRERLDSGDATLILRSFGRDRSRLVASPTFLAKHDWSGELRPQLITGDFTALCEAAVQGVGIALLPEDVCAVAVATGQLAVVLSEWETPQGILHFVYPSRRGMLPAVRSFIDFLAERLPAAPQALRER